MDSRRVWQAWGPAIAALIPAGIAAQSASPDLTGPLDPGVRAEIGYAEWLLNRMQLPDYAKIVVDRLKARAPNAEILLRVIELQSLLNVGKFEEAKAVIAREKDPDSQAAWAMKLALGDGYFAWGRYPEAQAVYNAFFARFKEGPPETLNDFYLNSAYKYAQMLVLMGKKAEAVEAYRAGLKAKLERHIRRQILSEMAELLLQLAEEAKPEARKPYFDELNKLTSEILWVQDVWFGKAIVYLAHMRMMQGDVTGAQKLIDEYGEQLRQIDEILKKQEEETKEPLTRLSPMAQCRYLLGVMMQQRAEKELAAGNRKAAAELLAGKEIEKGKRTAGALQHFLNVYVGYPETSWAPDAGIRYQQVRDLLMREFGARIQAGITREQMERVEKAQFHQARTLFHNQQFAQAAEAYVKVLNLFPETENSVAALGELARCYVETGEEVLVDLTVRYLAERFALRRGLSVRAGEQLYRTAEMYGERQENERRDALYALFFEAFSDHPLAALLLYRLAEEKMAAGDYLAAADRYTRISTGFTNAAVYVDALNKLALCYHKLGRFADEIQTLDRYLQVLHTQPKPGHAFISAKFRQGLAYRQMGTNFLANAANRFGEVIALLSATNHPYNVSAGDAERNQETLEGALFFRAACLAALTDPTDKVRTYRESAIRSLEQLVAQFPKSKYAPAALSQIGTLWTLLENAEKADHTLRRLQEEYPDSNEAKNSAYMRAWNLLQMGHRQAAIRAFKEMFAPGATGFTDAQILNAATELYGAREYDMAAEGFERVLASSKERAVRERAFMGKARVAVDQQKFEEAEVALQGLLKEFPASGFMPEALVLLARVYGELGSREPDATRRIERFNQAVEALNRARRIETVPTRQLTADLAVADMYLQKAAAEEKFGTRDRAQQYRKDAIVTFQNIIFASDPGQAEMRPLLEESYHRCLPLLAELGRWQDVLDDAESYLELFPMGKWVAEISGLRNRARVMLAAAGGGRLPEPGPSPVPVPTNAPGTEGGQRP